MSKPIIGISCSLEEESGGIFPGYKKSYVSDHYVQSVILAGGIPLLIPINSDLTSIDKYVDLIDGLVMSGGHDVDPYFYGEEPRQKIQAVFAKRDNFDLALIKAMVAQDKPILGICRGHQIINVAFGGKILQDLSYSKNELINHWQKADRTTPTHTITTSKDSTIYQIFGETNRVNSFHHQTVLVAGDGLEIVAWSKDDCIEATESKEKKILTVQWHPEMMSAVSKKQLNVFKWLIEKSSK